MSIIYTGAVFGNGALSRILEVAATAQVRDGGVSLDDELSRYSRLTQSSGVTEWAIPLATVAALLEFVADHLETDPEYSVSPTFRERLDIAADGMDDADYLRTVGSFLRDHDQRPTKSYQELPMAGWEAEVRFSKLRGFGAYWVEIAEYDSFVASIEAGIDSEHPGGCGEFLTPLATQAQEALILFPSDALLTVNLQPTVPWASHASLRQILHLINAHMSEQHGADE